MEIYMVNASIKATLATMKKDHIFFLSLIFKLDILGPHGGLSGDTKRSTRQIQKTWWPIKY